jgi:hypothetical protein
MEIGLAAAVILLAGLGCFLCARNVYVGIQTGTVLVRSAKYHRSEQPIYFWIGVTISALSAALLFAVVLAAVYFIMVIR